MVVWCGIRQVLVMASALMGAAVPLLRYETGLAAGADMELGRYLAAECMTCHRSANATSTIPVIFGLTEMHVIEVMKAYRNKSLPNPVMQNIAGRLTDEEIAALALYFASIRNP